MRSVTDRYALVQVLVNHDRLPGERVAPACLLELKYSVLDRYRGVLVYRGFVLHAKDQIEVEAFGALDRAAFLSGRDRDLAVELGPVFTAQELVGSLQIEIPTQPQ